MTVTRSLGGPDVAVTGGKPLDAALRMDLARLAEAHGLARLTWDGETVALRDRPDAALRAVRWSSPPPGAFLQATAEGEAALLAAVREAVGPARAHRRPVRGCGHLHPAAGRTGRGPCGRRPTPRCSRRSTRAGAQTPGLHRVTTEARDLFRRPLEPDELNGFDAVVIDPPRAGAEAQTAALARARVPVIAAVSCNPVTFARDARILIAGGLSLDWVQPVDQFRWSSHVELAARFHLPTR